MNFKQNIAGLSVLLTLPEFSSMSEWFEKIWWTRHFPTRLSFPASRFPFPLSSFFSFPHSTTSPLFHSTIVVSPLRRQNNSCPFALIRGHFYPFSLFFLFMLLLSPKSNKIEDPERSLGKGQRTSFDLHEDKMLKFVSLT